MTRDRNRFALDFNGDDFRSKPEQLIDPPVLQIYLAGSLTNNTPEIHQECVAVRFLVKDVFSDYEYLGVTFNVYDPADITPPGTSHTAEDVYIQDFGSTCGADLVIFHVNTPSLGVGMETQIAAFGTIPRCVIAKKDVAVSRMFHGLFSPTVSDIEYVDHSDLKSQLLDKLPSIAPLAIESAERRRPIINELSQQGVGRKFLKNRILKGVSLAELATQTDIREHFLNCIEVKSEYGTRLSLVQMARIASALECSTNSDGLKIEIKSESENELDRMQRQSLDSLASFVQARGSSINEQRVFSVWKRYKEDSTELATEAGRFRGESDSGLTVDDWRKRYEEAELF